MVEYICNVCTKKFYKKSNYETHIKRKYPCKIPETKINLRIQNGSDNPNKIVRNQCPHCFLNHLQTLISIGT